LLRQAADGELKLTCSGEVCIFALCGGGGVPQPRPGLQCPLWSPAAFGVTSKISRLNFKACAWGSDEIAFSTVAREGVLLGQHFG
jgi:hypothetical protein